MGGWIFAFLYLLVLSAIQRWWDRNVPRTWRYDPVRKWRTSRVKLFIKGVLLLIPPILVVTVMLGGSVLNAVMGAFFGMLGFTIFMETGSRLFLGWWHTDNPAYAALLRDGWDPVFDVSWFLNRDPEEVRAGQPPLALRGSNWVPPANWTERCPGCGASQPGPIFWCFFCGRGFEHRAQKVLCDCGVTFCESEPGISREMPVSCPGCGRSWKFG